MNPGSGRSVAATGPDVSRRDRIAFIHNFCTHYTVGTFEQLAQRHDVRYYFLSRGDEWYWLPQHGVRSGAFNGEYLPRIQFGPIKLMPALVARLWRGDFTVFVKSIGGRFSLLLTYLIARLRKKPFILWTGVWTRFGGWAHRLGAPVTRYIYRHADAIVAYGEHVKRFLVAEGVAPEKVFVAPHAVDNAAYSQPVSPIEAERLREQLGIARGVKLVLYLGRLERAKGLDYLLQAFALMADKGAVLVLAGAGPERQNLEQLAAQLGIGERLRFPGYVPIDQTRCYYAAAWVYVLPSITTEYFKEPWGLVVNEAFNQGLPVIASDSVGAAAGGLLENGKSGIVVPERDAPALATALDRLLADPALRTAMAVAARRKVESWDQAGMVRGFERALAFVRGG